MVICALPCLISFFSLRARLLARMVPPIPPPTISILILHSSSSIRFLLALALSGDRRAGSATYFVLRTTTCQTPPSSAVETISWPTLLIHSGMSLADPCRSRASPVRRRPRSA